MARPVKQRKISAPLNLFPAEEGKRKGANILFLTEEFEAIKLIDYEGLDHTQASKLMKISRSTFTRIYKQARIKIAASFVENRHLKLSEGNIYFNDNWYKCLDCECIYNAVKNSKNDSCPVCKSKNFLVTANSL